MVVCGFNRIIVFVAIYAAESGEIPAQMTVRAQIPFALMFSTINWEVHAIMIKSCWRPSRLGVTIFASRWETSRRVVRVVRTVIIIFMAAKTSVRCIVIIAIVASRTVILDNSMSPIQLVVIIMNWEGRWHPVWVSRMAHRTIHRYGQSHVVWIGSRIIIRLVAALASIRCVVIISSNMAKRTIISDGSMRTSQWIECTVVK